VEFPPYSAACYNDPSVGINPDAAYDCGKPTGPIWKVAWSGVSEKWPDATKIIENFTISNSDAAGMVAEVDLNGKSIDDTVAAWMEANTGTWSAWIK
jgi:glycine betaine/proline transport system substrate-binding protein